MTYYTPGYEPPGTIDVKSKVGFNDPVRRTVTYNMGDDELSTIQACTELLRDLHPPVAIRILNYLNERFGGKSACVYRHRP